MYDCIFISSVISFFYRKCNLVDQLLVGIFCSINSAET